MSKIYIPLCFYLYQNVYLNDNLALIFTFHYVSTYTVFRWADFKLSDFIYIPLCFYLYGVILRKAEV